MKVYSDGMIQSQQEVYRVFLFSECIEIQLESACHLCPLLSNIYISIEHVPVEHVEYYSYVMPHTTK